MRIKQSDGNEFVTVPHGPEDQRVEIAKGQEEYRTLHAIVIEPNNTTVICWRLPWRTRLRLLFTGKLWHSVQRSGPLQPILLSTRRHDHYLTSEELATHAEQNPDD